jgi:hypothetical protein
MSFWQSKWAPAIFTNGIVGGICGVKAAMGFNFKTNFILACIELAVVCTCALLAWNESRG